MNIHTTEAITALQRTVRMTIPQIGEQAAQAYENMRAEAQARQLVVNGPSIFVAHSMPQDAHTEFELTFCLPVKGRAVAGAECNTVIELKPEHHAALPWHFA